MISKKFILFSFLFWIFVFAFIEFKFKDLLNSINYKKEIYTLYKTDKNRLKSNIIQNKYNLQIQNNSNPLYIIINSNSFNMKHKYYSNSFAIDIIKRIKNFPKNYSDLLYLAVLNNDTNLVKALLNKNIIVKYDKTQNPLIYASFLGNNEIVKLLVNKVDINSQVTNYTNKIDNGSALYSAAKEGNIKTIELLLKNNANIELKNSLNYTPLDVAIIYDHIQTVYFLLTNKIKQAKVTQKELNLALKYKHYEIAKLLKKRLKNEK